MPELTDKERQAIASLERLAKDWPQSLMLLSRDSTLDVIRVSDYHGMFDLSREERAGIVLAQVTGIPNDGGSG